MFCRDKHNFVATRDVFCRDKHIYVVTKMILVEAPASDRLALFKDASVTSGKSGLHRKVSVVSRAFAWKREGKGFGGGGGGVGAGGGVSIRMIIITTLLQC